ncbi:3-hydroxyisobutyrate dehydrogenase [Aquidulcibacter sp.]|uniref:3-hydroxyisobutyrate dehydrogenase n=1 Tax=Aquidulcibacter sp. TaxID=2052990 RepID=UPI0025BB2119|nr:3-hydroxyisobutyrate dehydrogenase [Aquidulcibacter sp.]MCA3694085.1 3-hydroxyisobutyrate dehydrogenase [Aquidulcibacter sp.]
MVDIAFIGLGAMGSGMAANLAKAGHRVRAFDLVPAAIEAAVAAGCVAAPSVSQAVSGADFVVTMLPTGAHVLEVYQQGEGVLAHARPDAALIDCSTISVEDARAVGEAARADGFLMCDAPVSGGVAAAAAGTLTFMVGGSEVEFEKAKPVLQAMGKAVVHAGQSGAGQAAKICNNMLLAISMIGTCEAFVLAEKLGLDAKAFFDIASQSSGQSWSMTSYAPVPGLVPSAPSNRDFTNGFAGALMLKDLRLALEATHHVGMTAALALKSEEIYSEYILKYSPGRDFSGVIDMLRNQ